MGIDFLNFLDALSEDPDRLSEEQIDFVRTHLKEGFGDWECKTVRFCPENCSTCTYAIHDFERMGFMNLI